MKRVEGRAGFEPAPVDMLTTVPPEDTSVPCARHPPGGKGETLLGGTVPGQGDVVHPRGTNRVGVGKR